MRRNVRLILEPIALTILFFALVVWLYFAYSPAILERALELMGPTLVAEESARLSSLGSFLSAFFQGNLGYSFYAREPVWSFLLKGLGMTVTLIVLSTVISIATGVIFALIALKLEPRSRKPLTFVHSQKGFFFGLTYITGLILLILFSYRLGWFPSGHAIPDYWRSYPPENIFVEIAGRLRHLALPAFTLTIIFMVRSFFIAWSGSSTFTSKKTLKRLLLPFTTTDFACIISAVVLIEWTFWLPGVGFRLLQSILLVFDLTMTVGASIVLLAIAVILGYISVLLNFLQQHFGLREDLEKKVAPKSGPKEIFPQSSKYALLRRVARRVLKRKSLVIGSLIVVFFVVIAAFAPLLTPYDPLRLVHPPIAAHRAKPVWYRYLPGAEPVSENLQVVQQPSFDTAVSLEELNFTTSLAQAVSEQFVSDKGYKENGCVAIVFEREEAEAPFGQFKASLFKEFNFPYEAPPEWFIGQMAVMANASEDVPVTIDVVIENEGSERRLEWWNQTFKSSETTWTTPEPPIDSTNRAWIMQKFGPDWQKNPAHVMFSEQGNYRYGLEITFNDTQRPIGEKVEATIYIDDFDFKLFGSVFGLLGTDQDGRDIFTQVLYGTRPMLIATVPIVAVAAFIGLVLGFPAGYFQNWADNLVMVFVDTTLATPVLPLLIVFGLIYWYQGISWLLILLWPLCALATMASRKVYLLRPKNQKLSGNTIRSRFLRLFKDFSANFCLVMVSLTLLNLTISTLGFYEPNGDWSSILNSALSAGGGIEYWWWGVPPIVCTILFAVGFLLIGIGLDECLQPFRED